LLTCFTLVDISPLASDSLEARKECASKLLSAFVNDGFVYISHHPIAPTILETVFSHSQKFFARPQEQKDQLAWTTAAANRGYDAPGREKVSHGKTQEEVAQDRETSGEDLKESIEIGRDDEAQHPNQWPDRFDDEGKDFKTTMKGFFGECKALHIQIMSAIALGMGLEENFFEDFVKVGDNTLRLLHYPPVKSEVFRKNPGQVRAGAHTDYGSVTLLFQDTRGGLQVQLDNGEWKDVQPIPGTVVVNAGDLLARWSNDRIKSTTHRVVEPPFKSEGLEEYPPRYSVAYFCNPDFHKQIEALPGTYGAEQPKKYEGVNSGAYLVQRLEATY
jgi:isopenicillin N synthase-like dioxygenase